MRPPHIRNHFYELAALETDECVVWSHGKCKGYGTVKINGSTKSAHREALILRTGNRPGMDAAHGPCHDRACMNYRHIRWATRASNLADKVRDGTHNQGERQGSSKLTETEVRAIRQSADSGPKLALAYGVKPQTISAIRTRKTWRHVA